MQLTQYTDYSLRVLMYLGMTDETVTVTEIARRYGISRNHLVKVVHNLGKLGYVQTLRGRSGGLRLAIAPQSINIRSVVSKIETLTLLECLEPSTNTCPIASACRLKDIIADARQAFQDVLGQYTLADLLTNSDEITALLENAPERAGVAGGK